MPSLHCNFRILQYLCSVIQPEDYLLADYYNLQHTNKMDLLEKIMARAKANLQRIVLPEGTEIRTLKAADIILKEKAAKLILIGNESEIKQLAAENSLTNIGDATIVDPETNEKMGVYANLLYELRKSKGMTRNNFV